MTVRMLLLSVLLVGGAMLVCSSKVETTQDAMMYLKKYGYLQPVPSTDGTFYVTEEEMKQGICHFQYMFNLAETCELDDETMAMMNMPRCGMPDVDGHNPDLRQPKRYTLGPKWSKTNLTFRIDSVTPDIPRDKVETTLASALSFWSDETPLTFTRVLGSTHADIVINFYSGNHGDGEPFDGQWGVLAHAFYPEGGMAHFDEAEIWTILISSGINLLYVAVHEFGHNLGLGHSAVSQAVMAPRIREYTPNLKLHSDDIAGIRAHYGTSVQAAQEK